MKFESFAADASEKPKEVPGRVREAMRSLQERFRAYAPLAFFSFFAAMPVSANAQMEGQTENQKAKTETVSYGALFGKDSVEAEQQRAWLLDYIHSPKYRERLVREIGHTKDIAEAETASSEIPLEDLWPTALASEHLSGHIAKSADREIGKRASLVSSDTFVAVDAFNDHPLRLAQHFREGGLSAISSSDTSADYQLVYMPEKSIALKRVRPDTASTVPVHELTHSSLDDDLFIQPSTRLVLNKWTQAGREETIGINTPAEIIPRINAFRYIMKKQGIYDAAREDFSLEHLKKAEADSVITKESDVSELFHDILKGTKEEKEKTLIWLMNNIADARTPDIGMPSKDEEESGIMKGILA